MPKIIGHAQVFSLLEKMIKSQKLGSGLILVGPEGIGKRRIAEWVIDEIRRRGGSATRPNAGMGIDPDVMIIERQRNDKGDFKKNISIEQIRELTQRLFLSSFQNRTKIGMIDHAETLSEEASNALLKTLEDPLGGSLLLLLATNLATLPSTIASRCQVIHVPAVSSKEIIDALQQKGASESLALELAKLAHGRPGFALRLLEDPQMLLRIKLYEEDLQTFLQASLPSRLQIVQKIAKEPKEELAERISVWELSLHAKGALRENVNPTLALEHTFI